jgi:hypothetical protein
VFTLQIRCRIIIKKLTVGQLANNYSAFSKTKSFIIVFTTVRHQTVSSPVHTLTSALIFFLALSSHIILGLLSDQVLSFPIKTLQAIQASFMRASCGPFLTFLHAIIYSANRKYKGAFCKLGRLMQLEVHEDPLV